MLRIKFEASLFCLLLKALRHASEQNFLSDLPCMASLHSRQVFMRLIFRFFGESYYMTVRINQVKGMVAPVAVCRCTYNLCIQSHSILIFSFSIIHIKIKFTTRNSRSTGGVFSFTLKYFVDAAVGHQAQCETIRKLKLRHPRYIQHRFHAQNPAVEFPACRLISYIKDGMYFLKPFHLTQI